MSSTKDFIKHLQNKESSKAVESAKSMLANKVTAMKNELTYEICKSLGLKLKEQQISERAVDLTKLTNSDLAAICTKYGYKDIAKKTLKITNMEKGKNGACSYTVDVDGTSHKISISPDMDTAGSLSVNVVKL